MKKMLTLALVALSVASAQALTIDWSTVNWDRINEESGYVGSTTSGISTRTALGTTVDNTKSWIASTTVSISALLTWTSPGIQMSGNSAVVLSIAGLGNSPLVWGTSTTDMTLRSTLSGNTTYSTTALAANESVAVTYTWEANSSGGGTLSVYINDDLINSATFTSDDISATSTVYVGGYTVTTYEEYLSLEYYANYTAEAYVVQSATTESIDALVTSLSTTFNVVPEPTCLALLALGVAGLALKRKVA